MLKSYRELVNLKKQLESQIETGFVDKDAAKAKCKLRKAKDELKAVNKQLAELEAERPY